MDNKKFGDFIKELKKERKLTQKELGEKLNITDKAISKWERGKKQEIDLEKAIQEAIENYKNIEEKIICFMAAIFTIVNIAFLFNNETNLIKKSGTITLAEISMNKTKLESVYCMTYKNIQIMKKI